MAKTGLNLKLTLSIFVISTIIVSCSSLSRAQLDSVNKFANSCDSFSAYPSLIFKELHQIRKESNVWYAASLTQPSNRVNELNSSVQFTKVEEKLIKGVDISMDILIKYSRALKSLAHSNRVSDTGREIRRTGRVLDSLIISFNSLKVASPVATGIVSSAAKIVAYGAELNASRVRSEALRKFVPTGDTLVSQLCLNIEDILKGKEIKSLVEHEQKMIENNYLSYINITGSSIEEDRRYIELRHRADELTKLRTSTIISTGALRRAHNKLASQIEEGITLAELLNEIEIFRDEVKKLYKLTQKW